MPPLMVIVPVAAMLPRKMELLTLGKMLTAPVSVVVPTYVRAPELARESLARLPEETQFPATFTETLFDKMWSPLIPPMKPVPAVVPVGLNWMSPAPSAASCPMPTFALPVCPVTWPTLVPPVKVLYEVR